MTRRAQIQVVAGLLERGGRVLVQRRPPHKERGRLWEFPGGKVEPREAPAEALRREWMEELGCEIRVGEPLWQTQHAYENVEVQLELFRCELVSGEPSAREGQELRWAAPADLGELPFVSADVPVVKLLAEGTIPLESPNRA